MAPLHPPPSAVFSGWLGDPATGGWSPTRAEVGGGWITLWIASANGWEQHFRVSAPEVAVKSAAQRITLVVRGQNFPILSQPAAVDRSMAYGAAGAAGGALHLPALRTAATVGRGFNQASAASAFNAGGGPQFLAAARASGAQVSRVGYGPLLGIGCVVGVVVVIAVVVITMALLSP